jgi:hypothetical protein
MKSKISVDNNALALPVSSTKPLEHIQRLIDAITPYSESFTPLKGEALRYMHHNRRVCYLLHEGNATLHRRGDGMILNSEKGPFLMGVSNLQTQLAHLYVRPMENAKMSRIPLERLSLVIEKENLWESLCHLIIFTASRIYEHCAMIAQLSSYEIIRFQLLELMQEPERLRLNVTAANYIQNRTYLSRSGIMRILSHLRDAQCITLQRGVLLEVHSLPPKFS